MTLTLDLTSLLASQINGYIQHDGNYTIDKLKKINYVMASNGVFRVEKTPVALYKSLIATIQKPIPGLLPMSEGPELLIPKIPFRLLQMALTFYRDVYDKDHTEASLLFFWNKDNRKLPTQYTDNTPVKGLFAESQFVVYVPRQVNSGGLSEFHMDPMVDWLRDNMAILCESHSHHTMNAFFSGTDDANENATQFYFVWGQIKNEKPQYAFRYVSGDAKVRIEPDVLFDWPVVHTMKQYEVTCSVDGFEPKSYREEETTLYYGPFPRVDYPAEWMEQHKKKKIAAVNPAYTAESAYLSKNPYPLYTQTELDFYEEQLYPQYYEEQLDSRFSDYHGGMEEAEIVQFLEPEDEFIKNDIMDNVLDLTGEYSKLGFDKVIERTIEAVYKK